MDGDVTSLELFDAKGNNVVIFFGKRNPANPRTRPGARSWRTSSRFVTAYPSRRRIVRRISGDAAPLFLHYTNIMKLFFSILAVAALSANLQAKERIVSAAGAITETIYALGAQDELAAVDVSSVYPAEANALPKIGYARQLSAEGILSMNPTVVLVTEDAGPPEVLKQIADAKVKVISLTNKHTPEAAAERILQIGEAINRKAEAEKLVAKLNEEVAAAKALAAGVTSKPRVMFIYARGGGVDERLRYGHFRRRHHRSGAAASMP